MPRREPSAIQMIARVDSLRTVGSGSADPQKLIGQNIEEQASMDRYAYPFAGPAFRPHFTVGRIENSNKNEVPVNSCSTKDVERPV